MAEEQNEYGLPIGKGEKRRTARLLPRYYRTESNKKFIQATVDQLTQSGTVKKLNGYIGRQNAKAVTGSDVFVETATSDREHYQLEPCAVVKDTLDNVTFFKDYIDYINTVDVLGGTSKNHQKLNKQEFYSWNPHISWDKFVNFQQYYWLPYGPDIIKVAGQQKDVVSTYTVSISDEGDNRAYLFTPDGLTRNPNVKLFRGQTYRFEISANGEPFSIKTQREAGTLYRYTNGVSSHAVEYGVVTFTVPDDAPDVLYYVSENSVDTGGAWQIFDITENTSIDVDAEIVGKKTYQLASGLALSNGMKITFTGEVSPATYASGNFYVEGVGTTIKLVPENSLEIITGYSEAIEILFDDAGFDTVPFSDATAFAAKKDYVTINRSNTDGNPWSRYNRWFHQDVIMKSAEAAGVSLSLDQLQRATRPIIEFESNIKLFNFGTVVKNDVDLIDIFTKDIFSTIEGTAGYNIDGISLSQNQRILFTADTDPLVKNRIFKVDFITVNPTVGNPVRQIHLVEETDAEPLTNESVLVRTGDLNQGKMYWFNGTNWIPTQEKTSVNQAPLFDLFDSNKVSLTDPTVYPGSTFAGNKIFSYKVNTSGTNDIVLGFPLTYRNINNIGDIVFTFDLLQNQFSYKQGVDVLTKNTDAQYLKLITGLDTGTYINGWVKNTLNNVQPIVRIYKDSGLTTEFPVDVYDNIAQLLDLEVRVYVNGKRLDKSKWNIVDGVKYKKVVLTTAVETTDVVTLKCFSKQDKNTKGYYELPVNFQNNPLNNNVNTFTLGEALDHVDSIIDNNAFFSGAYPGSGNLRDLGDLATYGTKFVQHSGPLNFGLYHLTSKNANAIKALKQARDDYGKFKRNFVNVSEILNDESSVKVFVDNILFETNKDRSKTSPYYFSDMIGYGAATKTDYTVVDFRIKTYPLSEIFSLNGLSNKSVNVYVNDEQLLYEKDYTFNETGFVELTETAPLANGDIITVYEYESTDGCFVPPTPTSLGLWPKFEPKKYLDTTLVTPQNVLQGHDGSIILAYNDYRDNLILELEKRIFNNIKVNYDTALFDVLDFIPGYNRTTEYSREEFNEILAPTFYQWTTLIDRDFTKPLSYSSENAFTYNYKDNTALDGSFLPGYWRGIYRWMFDTDRIHICPWESLGYSIEPTWWKDVYGVAPYTSNNLILWEDIKAGIIREPGKPVTRIAKFARPVIGDIPPVDEEGNLLDPIMSNIAQGVIKPQMSDNFVFGDESPVEATWRRSSYYPFSILTAAILMHPNKVLGACLDRSRIIRNLNDQLVYKDTGLRVRLQDIVFPSIPSDNARVQTAGLINYITDYILSDNLRSLTEYKQDLSKLSNQLSHRLGGFTSKEKYNLILDSKSPTANAGVFVPKENYSIFLNTGSPTSKLNYSGVIVTKLLTRNGVGYEVKGYSQSAPFFYYYPWTQSGNTINVGGISESYISWTSGQAYVAGNIVKYNNAYYRVKSNHTAQESFDVTLYQKLPALPIIGGRDAVLRKAWDRVPNILNYGTTFSSIQEVVDFLQGYSEYLKDQGFVFDDYNTNLREIASWDTAVKEFMFWTTQNWSTGVDKFIDWLPNTEIKADEIVVYNGDFYTAIKEHITSSLFDTSLYSRLDSLSQEGASVISLSPSALGLSMKLNYNVIDDIRDQFNEYEIFKADGLKFDQNFLNYTREDNEFSFSPRVNGVGIYGAGFYLVQKEHVLIIDNTTQFNDTIYNLEAGYRQERIKVSGYRTVNWYGGFDIPGFIFDQAKVSEWQPWTDYNLGDIVKYKEFYYSAEKFISGTYEFNTEDWIKLDEKPTSALLPNWDYKAEQFTDFYDLDSDNFDSNQQKIAQHLIGYQKRQYLENIIKNDVSEYKFYQGMIQEKGSVNSLNKLFDVLSASDQESIDFNEEWAVRIGQYGGSDAFDEIEITLDESLFKTNPQAFELVTSIDSSKVDFVVRQTPNQLYIKPADYNNNPWPVSATPKSYLRTPGYVRYDQITLNIDAIIDLVGQDITQFAEGDYIWTAFDSVSWDPVSWNIYRFTKAEFLANDVEYTSSTKTVKIQFDRIPNLTVGDVIGITNSAKLQGFYKVETAVLNTITLTATIAGWVDPFQDSSQILFYKLTPQRVQSIDDNIALPKLLKNNELLWIDSNASGKNSVWQNTPVYTKRILEVPATQTESLFGKEVAISGNSNTLAVSTDTNKVIVYKKYSNTVGWTRQQVIPVNGSALAFSFDSNWLAIGDSSTGEVSVYERNVNGDYNFLETITVPGSTNFGSKIKFATTSFGYRMIVTAPNTGGTGAVYVYSFTTTWELEGPLGLPPGAVGFGYDIDITADGSTLVVSSPTADSFAGQVYVYNYTSSLYELIQTLDSGAVLNERYGESVAITSSGDLIAVGSASYDDEQVDQGLVRLYKLDAGEYVADQLIKNRNPEEAESFGANVQFINGGISLVVFSAFGDSITRTTFDVDSGTPTTFDSGTTVIATRNRDVGRFDIYDRYSTKFLYAESLSVDNALGDSYGYAFAAGDNTIITSAINSGPSGRVYSYSKASNAYSWSQIQEQSNKVDLNKIKKVFLYNKKTNELISYLDVIDPVQGKIAGIAEQEIKYKTYYDPATYSVGNSAVNVDDGMAWTGTPVGTLWWDLTRAKFLDSYTGDVVYKNSTWNTLYDTGSIDIYEWVESKYLPADWDALADTEAGLSAGISGTSLYGNTVYSIKKRYDTVAKSFKNTYYFWVKNKTIVPNNIDRSQSASDVANLIADPKSQGHKYIEFTGTDSFSLVNVDNLLQQTDIVLTVQYWLVDSDDLNVHTDWKIISEHPNTTIPQTIERKWVDSLVGVDDNNRTVPDMNLPPKQKFGIQFRPRQSMFVNRLEALKQYVERVNYELKQLLIVDSADLTDLNSFDPVPSTISGMYDQVVDAENELRLINTGSAITASLTPVIVDGKIVDVVIDTAGSGYIHAPLVTITGSGTKAKIKTVINANGSVVGVDIINKGTGYTNSTTLSLRSLSVLVLSDSLASGRWAIYEYNSSTLTWVRTRSQSYNVTDFWSYLDWYDVGYNQFTKIDHVVNGTYELYTLAVDVGQIVKVKTVGSAGWMLLEKYANVNSIDYTLSYKVIGRQNGTIAISNKFYQFANTNSGFDGPLYDIDSYDNSGSTELKIILTALRDKILIDDLRTIYLQLFFASLKYALSEQTFIDWAFKTSFVKAMHNVGELKQKVTYNNDNLTDFENYINEVKPYRTKIREYVSAYNSLDNSQTMVTDFDLPAVGRGKITEPLSIIVKDGVLEYTDSELLTYPWKHWLDNAGFYISSIDLVDSGSGYINRPIVNIIGDCEVPATARAYVANGIVTKIELLTPGSGYLSAPTIEISGGISTTGVIARAVAIIKNDLVRSNLIKIKFDRITNNYFITKLDVSETFIGTGSRLQWPLTWSPDLKVGNTVVTINGQEALRDTYTISTKKTITRGYTAYSGLLTFNTAPESGAEVVIEYMKDFNYLNAADRINFYYNPTTGQLGKDLAQLMTGVDYGGVNIVGLNFKSSAGWDDLPWFSDVWDGVDPTFDDFITTVDNSTQQVTLNYTPTNGQQLNVYLSRYNSLTEKYDDAIRLDDPYYTVYDGSTVQPNGRTVAPTNALMQTLVGNGTTDTFEFPENVSVIIDQRDKIIIRKTTSDGSSTPNSLDYDTALSGGTMVYDTATGLTADDIIVDGDGFVTPTSSPATEEVVPGQMTDAVAIKVFHKPASGSASIISNNFIGDGVTATFNIGQFPNSQSAVTVKVGNNIINNFTVDYNTKTVTLATIPANKEVVSITSFGYNGEDIVDLDYFVGDGSSIEFITNAPWDENVSALIVVAGAHQDYQLFATDGSYSDLNRIGIRFGSAPIEGAIINYVISSTATRTFSLVTKETFVTDGSTLTYQLENPIGNAYPYEPNIIVRTDNTILTGPNNSYFTLSNNNLIYTIPAHLFQADAFDISDFTVYLDGNELTLMADYTIDLTLGQVILNSLMYTEGAKLIVSILTTADYFINNVGTECSITFTAVPGIDDTYEVTALYKHDILDIERTEAVISPNVSLTQDTVEYFVYNQIKGGTINLGREVLSDDYVWVVKNNAMLTHSVDYKLNPNMSSIKLAVTPTLNDKFVVITFSKNIVTTAIGYMQFKDILNRDHYKRMNKAKSTPIAANLNYYDNKIVVEDGSVLTAPNRAKNIPGVVYLNGERIEYFVKNGNTLSQIRRGTLGTGTPPIHIKGEVVLDIGITETIPYNDSIIIDTYVHDGSTNLVPLQYVPQITSTDGWINDVIPTGYGQCDEIDVFVGGWKISPWITATSYSVGEIVIYGSYTFKCVTAHTSEDFNSDRTNWELFVGNQHLKKHPYSVHNVENHYESPEGDVDFEADFAVDGDAHAVRLTNDLTIGTKVIVTKKVGRVWNDSNTSLMNSNNKIINFIRASEGVLLTVKNPRLGPDGIGFDETITSFDSNNLTFDKG